MANIDLSSEWHYRLALGCASELRSRNPLGNSSLAAKPYLETLALMTPLIWGPLWHDTTLKLQ